MKLLTWVITLIILSTSILYANCDSVIETAGKNVSITSGSSAVIANKYASACLFDRVTAEDTTIAKVDVEVFGSGGGSGNLSIQQKRDRLTNWCTLNKDTYVNNQTAYQQTQSVYGASVAAWLACKNIEAKTLELNPNIADDMLSITFLVRWPIGGGAPFQGIFSRGFDCKATVDKHGTLQDVTPNRPIQIDSNGVPIACTRAEPTPLTINGQKVQKYPSGTITVNAAGTSFKIDFAELHVPEITEVTKNTLTSSINRIDQDLKSEALTRNKNVMDLNGAISALNKAVGVANNSISSNKYWSNVFWKNGNDGSASCDTFCRGDIYPGGVGSCVGARFEGNGSQPNHVWSCGERANPYGGDHISCLCMNWP